MTVEDLRNICMSMPHVVEDVKYGSDLCFSIGNKIFCGTRIDGPFRTGIKCNEIDFAALCDRAGIVPMPRLSVTYWIRVEDGNALSLREWEEYIKKSYGYVLAGLPDKIRRLLM